MGNGGTDWQQLSMPNVKELTLYFGRLSYEDFKVFFRAFENLMHLVLECRPIYDFDDEVNFHLMTLSTTAHT
jgi:hypothetical protein